MSIPVLAFFNNKGGVGKTSLVYHLAWMYADRGIRVVAADLDPQANLTSAFLSESRIEELWPDNNRHQTIFGIIQPILRGIGDIAEPYLEYIEPSEAGEQLSLFPPNPQNELALLVGDLALSTFEDQLSEVWPKCLDRDERSFRVISAFWRVMQKAAAIHRAQVILVDLGPNLGAINRAALIAADYVIIPLSPDLFSLQGLRNLGPQLRNWRKEWAERRARNTVEDLTLPGGAMQPAGYIVLHHAVRLDRPVKAYDRWVKRIPEVYRSEVLGEPADENITIANDPHSLALLKDYRSLMPMAQEARKPMFFLKSADGAIGAHLRATHNVYKDFRELAKRIAERTFTKENEASTHTTAKQ